MATYVNPKTSQALEEAIEERRHIEKEIETCREELAKRLGDAEACREKLAECLEKRRLIEGRIRGATQTRTSMRGFEKAMKEEGR